MDSALDIPMIVLAGGFGTRLRSVVPDLPKPMAPVAGRPFLAHLIEAWVAQGLREFAFSLHHQAELIIDYVEAERAGGLLAGCRCHFAIEPEPLGTGGAIRYAARKLGFDGPFLVANADTWLSGGIAEMVCAPGAAMALAEVENTERYGRVELAGDRVAGFAEKEASRGRGWINAGLYRLSAGDLGSAPYPFSFERDVVPGLVAEGRLGAVRIVSEFIDIGIPSDYARFCSRFADDGATA